MSPEITVTQEKTKSPSFDVILARHAEYYDIASENQMFAAIESLPEAEKAVAEEEIKKKLGHLTELGHQQAAELGEKILNDVIKDGTPTDITFIPSKQEYESPRYIQAPWAGRRAEETSTVAIQRMMDLIQQLEDDGQIPNGHIRFATPVPQQPFTKESQPNGRITERNVYYSPKSSPTSLVDAYKQRTKEIIDKEKEIGETLTKGFVTLSEVGASPELAFSNREKEIWARGQEDLDKFGEEIDNETSKDVAQRTMRVIGDINHLAQLHQYNNPERRLIAVVVSHDALIGAVSHQAFGVETPVIPSFAKALDIHIEDGQANLEYDGKYYSKELPISEQN